MLNIPGLKGVLTKRGFRVRVDTNYIHFWNDKFEAGASFHGRTGMNVESLSISVTTPKNAPGELLAHFDKATSLDCVFKLLEEEGLL